MARSTERTPLLVERPSGGANWIARAVARVRANRMAVAGALGSMLLVVMALVIHYASSASVVATQESPQEVR
jgi:hypothetical protein